jgi:hypothetical protein
VVSTRKCSEPNENLKGIYDTLTHIAAKPPIFIYFLGFLSFKKVETLAGKHFHF